MSGQNQTWKMGPISASQRLNGQWSGHIQSWALGDRSFENQLTHTRPGVTMAIDRRNKSCVCRYFIDEGFEMIHCLTHSIHLFLNLNLNSEWGVESMMTITSFPSLQTWCDWYRHKLPTFSLVLPYSFWSDRVTRYHGNTGLLAISVLMDKGEGEGRRGTLVSGGRDMMRISALPGTISPASRSSSYFVPWSNLARSDIVCAPYVTRSAHQTPGDSAGSSPGADQETVCCPCRNSAINPSYSVHTVVNTPPVHTQVTWAWLGTVVN